MFKMETRPSTPIFDDELESQDSAALIKENICLRNRVASLENENKLLKTSALYSKNLEQKEDVSF
jgi:hypothetical protein